MRSFFVDADANIRAIIDAVTPTTEVSTSTTCKQGSGLLSKPTNGASNTSNLSYAAVDSPLFQGRNGPASTSGAANNTAAVVSATSCSAERFRADLALANLRDAAQQLGLRHLAASANTTAAELEQPIMRHSKAGAQTPGTAARLLWELRRAEAAWRAADFSGTVRVVVKAVSTVASAGGPFRPMSGALRFRRE